MLSRREPSSHARRAGAPAHRALPYANTRTARGADQGSVPKGASAAQCCSRIPPHRAQPGGPPTGLARRRGALLTSVVFCAVCRPGLSRSRVVVKMKRVGAEKRHYYVTSARARERDESKKVLRIFGPPDFNGNKIALVYYLVLCNNEAQRESHLRHASLANPCRHIAYLRVHSCHRRAVCR